MKNKSKILFLTLILALAVLLSACSGGTGTATSWPGITADQERGLVYVAYNNFVHAVDLSNGTQKWQFPQEADNKITFFAPPALAPDGQLLIGGYNNLLYSLDPETGQQNQSNWPFQAKNRFIAAPLATETSVYAPSADEQMYSLTPTGSLRWNFKANQSLWATPITNDGVVYLPSMDHHLYALDAETGELIWQTERLGGAMVGQPALSDDGTLYIGTFASEMLAIDSHNGKVVWRQPTNGWVWSGPILENGLLYFGDLEGYFYVLDAADGKTVWQREPGTAGTDASVTGQPLLTDDTVYYGIENGTLYAVDKASGTQRWEKTFPGKFFSAPVAAGDLIVVAPMGGESLLIALDTGGGQRWTFSPQD